MSFHSFFFVSNVGKSTILANLRTFGRPDLKCPSVSKRKRRGPIVGKEAGITKSMSYFTISHRPKIQILDSPGIFIPKFKIHHPEIPWRLALVGAIRQTQETFDAMDAAQYIFYYFKNGIIINTEHK